MIFNPPVGVLTAPWFIIMFLISLGTAYFLYATFKKTKQSAAVTKNILEDKNPLEFKIAVVFV